MEDTSEKYLDFKVQELEGEKVLEYFFKQRNEKLQDLKGFNEEKRKDRQEGMVF